MPRTPHSTEIRGQLVFLGTGTSMGVPVIGCDCPVCSSSDPRNNRTRCALMLGLPEGNLLVDTPPDLRTQLIRERLGLVHATLFTHAHADHMYGLDDLRLFPYYLGHRLTVYCEAVVEAQIRASFAYAFDPELQKFPAGSVPQLGFQTITSEPFEVLGARVYPIRLLHGKLPVLGFRFGNIAYCTDTNAIPEGSWSLLENLDVLILDALRHASHPTHFSLDEAIAVSERVRPRRTLFTHMSHDLDHAATNAALPPGMELAYDGLKIPLT